MRTKFVLKAKKLNKKWLNAVKALYGKKSIVITIQTEEDYDLDFAFEEDSDFWDDDFLFEEEEEDEEEEEEDEEEEGEEKKEEPVEEAPTPKKQRASRKKTEEKAD